MKILITGGSGQVGFELRRSLVLFGEILAPTRRQLDLADDRAVEEYLHVQQPDLIVNAAAYTAVDRAESDIAQAQRLNAGLPAQLARYAKANNILLVHYSSDYVYSGRGNTPFNEKAATSPLNVYGKTKLEGDEAIAASGCRHLIFRTSWVYSCRGNNFMKTMLKLAMDKSSLGIVSDQIGTPTPARLIADVTARALMHSSPVSVGIAKTVLEADNDGAGIGMASGIYHLAPRGETSWYGFAQAIFKLAQEHGLSLRLQPDNNRAIMTREYPTPAQRPLNSRLNVEKLEQSLGLRLPHWLQQLELTFEETIA